MDNWEAIFDIVENKSGFYAVFKHDGTILNDITPCRWRVYAESIAFNWMADSRNEKKILDIMMELTILEQQDV